MPRKETEVVGQITDIEIIAVNLSIRELDRLRQQYGGRRWRKLKGKAMAVREDGSLVWAEVHWYECHGIGRRELGIKRELK